MLLATRDSASGVGVAEGRECSLAEPAVAEPILLQVAASSANGDAAAATGSAYKNRGE